MKLIINGKEASISECITVNKLLTEQNVKMPEMVSVELNGEILKRSEYENKSLQDGDKVEFLYFMGGGS